MNIDSKKSLALCKVLLYNHIRLVFIVLNLFFFSKIRAMFHVKQLLLFFLLPQLDSNQRMKESKSFALPLGYGARLHFISCLGEVPPSTTLLTYCLNIFVVNRSQCPYRLGQEFSYANIPPYAF